VNKPHVRTSKHDETTGFATIRSSREWTRGATGHFNALQKNIRLTLKILSEILSNPFSQGQVRRPRPTLQSVFEKSDRDS